MPEERTLKSILFEKKFLGKFSGNKEKVKENIKAVKKIRKEKKERKEN